MRLWDSATGKELRSLLGNNGGALKPVFLPGGKKLTRKDLGLDEETFADLDADGDGVLDREELAHFAQRNPDLQLNVRIGDIGRGEETVAIVPPGDRKSPLAANLRKGPDNSVVLDLGNTRLELRTAPGGGMEMARGNLKEFYKAPIKSIAFAARP